MKISSLIIKLLIGFLGMFLANLLASSISIYVMVAFLIYTFMVAFNFIKNNFIDNEEKKVIDLNSKQEKYLNNHLSDHFKIKDEFEVGNNLSLKPIKKHFHSYDKLVLAYQDESIVTIAEFELNHPELARYLKAAVFNYFLNGKLKLANVSINQENSELSRKIFELENLVGSFKNEELNNGLKDTSKLLKETERLSEQMDFEPNSLHRLQSMYLKQLFLVINKYQEVNKVDSQEYKKLENQLINSITLVNEAIKNINSDLTSDDYIDVETDMVVLESILQQDQKIKK